MRKSSVQLLFHVFEQAKCCPVSAKLNSRILGSTRSPVLNGLSQKTQTHRLPPKADATRDHVSRLMPPSYFPRAPPQLQRFLRANSFHATAISSPNSASPPLQHRNRGYKEPRFRLSRRLRSSTRSTLLPPLAAFPPRRGRESEVGIVACRVNRGKASLSRSNRSERERISAEFNVRGGCDCAPLRGTIRGTVREGRGGRVAAKNAK